MTGDRTPESGEQISEPRRNIELKARDIDPGRSLAVCESLAAEKRGTLVQRDTYFNVASGRLKLREQEGDIPHLIAYERSNQSAGRESRYRIVEVQDAGGLKEALTSALGVMVVVAKRRQLFLWQAVRIHLDCVESLGNFLEFEAVATSDSDLSFEQSQVLRLRRIFEIEDAELIGGSYCDLARAGSARPPLGPISA